jgi:hydroxymethylglutaryl-CoA lyase
VWLAEEVVGHSLYGFTSKAGPLPRHDKLYAMDMPHIETLEQAKHFIKGPKAYEGAHSPWKEPITSWMRPEAPGYKEKQEKLAQAKSEESAQPKAASTQQSKVAAG